MFLFSWVPAFSSLRPSDAYICISKLTIIGSDNVASLGIIWTNAGILLIGPPETNFSEILIIFFYIFIQENAFENIVWKMAAILSLPQCVKPGLNVLNPAWVGQIMKELLHNHLE